MLKKILSLLVVSNLLLFQAPLIAQDAGISDILSPKPINYCHKDSVDFTYVVTNFGATPLTGLIHSVIVAPVNVGGTPYNNTGVIAMLMPGASDTITYSGMDISLTDEYIFTAYTLVTGDVNPANDISFVQPFSSHTTVDSLLHSHLNCNGDSSGTITAYVSNGIGDYTYNWSNAATTASIMNLAAGSYTCFVSDSVGCLTKDSVVLTEPVALSASAADAGNGSAVVTASGGTTGSLGYSFLWDNGTTTATASGLSNGMHSVTVTDDNNCTDTAMVNVVVTAVDLLSSNNSLTIFPNPTKNQFTIKQDKPNNSPFFVRLYSLRGELLYFAEFLDNSSKNLTISGLDLPTGIYLVQMMNGEFMRSTKLYIK